MKNEIMKPNDAWILHREEVDTVCEGCCNVYVLIDAATGHCYGLETAVEHPTADVADKFLLKALKEASATPKQILIAKSDPHADFFETVFSKHKLILTREVPKTLHPLIQSFSLSFKNWKMGKDEVDSDESTQEVDRELESFIPKTYEPCPCASGKKFKFCCKNAFEDISFAMCAAEDGDLNEAIHYMQLAESKVGRTAEICCRYAICWSFFDDEKYQLFLAETYKLNKNHPRLNYILGVDAKHNGYPEKAVKFYQTAIENYPKSDKYHLNETYNNLGNALYDLKKYHAAKEAWEKGLVLLPHDKMTLDNLFDFIYDNPELPDDLREMTPFIQKQLANAGISVFDEQF